MQIYDKIARMRNMASYYDNEIYRFDNFYNKNASFVCIFSDYNIFLRSDTIITGSLSKKIISIMVAYSTNISDCLNLIIF